MSLSCWTALGQSYYSCLPWAWSEMKNHNYCWLNWNLFFSTSPINRNNVTRESDSESCIFNKCADFSRLKTKKKSNHVEMLLVGKTGVFKNIFNNFEQVECNIFRWESFFFSWNIFSPVFVQRKHVYNSHKMCVYKFAPTSTQRVHIHTRNRFSLFSFVEKTRVIESRGGKKAKVYRIIILFFIFSCVLIWV